MRGRITRSSSGRARRRIATGCAIALLGLAMTACTRPAPAPTPTLSTPAIAPSTVTPEWTPTPDGNPRVGPTVTITAIPPNSDENDSTPGPVPVWDDKAAAEAAHAADAALTAFLAPTTDWSTWWGRLAPQLSDYGQRRYRATDPANIPAVTVTGPCQAVNGGSVYVATATCPSDRGAWTLTLTRRDANSGWLTDYLKPPEGIH